MPKSFDPARASASPETDVVRAVFEGLTDTDPKTLQTVPAIAIDWKSSEDFKTWTFVLRRDARWSNGERITAKDFVRSWKRLAALGDKVSHRELFRNIVGLPSAATDTPSPISDEATDSTIFSPEIFDPIESVPNRQTDSNANVAVVPPSRSAATDSPVERNPIVEKAPASLFGVEAIDNFTLKIALVKPDRDFPALVAHPIFRPIYGDGKNFETNKLNADIVTSGAFRVASVGQEDGITLDRAEKYWNREAVELERVRFVPTENAEKALAAYRSGEIDAVTNADFAPLALKLLTPFEDFRRTTHGAINFYEFNQKLPPFDDRRVREALAIAIERERLTEDEMDGASLPALSFLPIEKAGAAKITQDAARARALLAESGFPNGENFPTVKLLVNRNNLQQRIARAVAKMWKRALNITTEIVVRDAKEIDGAWATGEFALLRRGVVLPTANETINLSAIFEHQTATAAQDSQSSIDDSQLSENPNADASAPPPAQPKTDAAPPLSAVENKLSSVSEKAETITTEERAIGELPAIPLYFPTSYSLVKSYIQGFDANVLGAPSLKTVRINYDWQPKTAKSES